MASAVQPPAQLVELRELMKKHGVSAYILRHTDAHQSEYVAEKDKRVAFLSGFTGSNATAMVTAEKAAVWTDGRYFLQAGRELYPTWELVKTEATSWLVDELRGKSNAIVGFDPELISLDEVAALRIRLAEADASAVPLSENLSEAVWRTRPQAEVRPVLRLGIKEAGATTASKLEAIRAKITSRGCDAIILNLLDDVAWTLNVRGFDIPCSPVVESTLFVTLTDAYWFVDPRKVPSEISVALGLEGISIRGPEEAQKVIRDHHEAQKTKQGSKHRVWLPSQTNFYLAGIICEPNRYVRATPVQAMKAVKNEVELKGMRKSAIRDSAAIIQFLAWLQGQLEAGAKVTEISAADKIKAFRAEKENFVEISFETISAVGANSALPHYKPDPTKEVIVSRDSVYLIDSGGQYRDGTTDVTRTVCHAAQPDADFIAKFTLVLKCHIDLADLAFPQGIASNRLDSIARLALWREGLDYGHGVGHGVGHFLNVHEGPVNIGVRVVLAENEVWPGQVITIEPGYYEENKFGIRIENCYEVIRHRYIASGAENFVGFKSLTWVPIQRNLIDKKSLEPRHIQWVDNYHAECFARVGPYLQKHGLLHELAFMQASCQPL